MSGTLDPDSTPGGGLTMTLRLPETAPPAPARAADPDDDSQPQDADPLLLQRIDQWTVEDHR
jgi:hypothetical protein